MKTDLIVGFVILYMSQQNIQVVVNPQTDIAVVVHHARHVRPLCLTIHIVDLVTFHMELHCLPTLHFLVADLALVFEFRFVQNVMTVQPVC